MAPESSSGARQAGAGISVFWRSFTHLPTNLRDLITAVSLIAAVFGCEPRGFVVQKRDAQPLSSSAEAACAGDTANAACSCEPGETQSCYTGPPRNAGVGACVRGTKTCVDGRWSSCEGAVSPQTETCGDQIDGDCDGLVDEGCQCAPGDARECYAGAPETLGVGPCRAGVQLCNVNGRLDEACRDQVTPKFEELGNDIDDDCNGTIERPTVCVPQAELPCYTGPAAAAGIGICRAGKRICNDAGTGWSECLGQIHPQSDLCDDLDNDCDGLKDDGLNPIVYFQDNDGDGFGNPAVSTVSCAPVAGYVKNGEDCDDTTVQTTSTPTTYVYRDRDGDGSGAAFDGIWVCAPQPPPGYTTNFGDLDDANTTITANTHKNFTVGATLLSCEGDLDWYYCCAGGDYGVCQTNEGCADFATIATSCSCPTCGYDGTGFRTGMQVETDGGGFYDATFIQTDMGTPHTITTVRYAVTWDDRAQYGSGAQIRISFSMDGSTWTVADERMVARSEVVTINLSAPTLTRYVRFDWVGHSADASSGWNGWGTVYDFQAWGPAGQ